MGDRVGTVSSPEEPWIRGREQISNSRGTERPVTEMDVFRKNRLL